MPKITEDDYFPPLRAPSHKDQVANKIIVDTQKHGLHQQQEEVYRSNEPIHDTGKHNKDNHWLFITKRR